MRLSRLIAVIVVTAVVPASVLAQEARGGTVYTIGNGVSAPVLVKEVKPQYTPDAMRARIQGVVTLECIVRTDGTVGDATVKNGLNPELDQEAIKAVGQWRFKPGRKDGRAVPVRVRLEMTFTLRDKPATPLFPIRPPAGAGAVTPNAQKTAAGPVYKPGEGVLTPVVVREVKPQYTARANDAKIQGVVELACVVETDGSVGDVTVTKPLDEDLDQEAVKAARQWRFEPGKKDGKAVRVQITLEMTFTVR